MHFHGEGEPMNETKEPYDAVYVSMTEGKERCDTTYGLTPRGRLHLAKQELHRALSDLVAHAGVFPGDWTSETSVRINRDCCAVIAANWRHEEARVAAAKAEQARRGMLDDIGPSWWEYDE
jgi:hypothetical protein